MNDLTETTYQLVQTAHGLASVSLRCETATADRRRWLMSVSLKGQTWVGHKEVRSDGGRSMALDHLVARRSSHMELRGQDIAGDLTAFVRWALFHLLADTHPEPCFAHWAVPCEPCPAEQQRACRRMQDTFRQLYSDEAAE